MIRYILGRTGSGKSKLIHEQIKKNIINKTEKLFLIVPEQYTLQAEIDLIKDMKVEGIIDVEVMSFNRLCNLVLVQMGGFSEVEINNLGKAMVLRSIIDKHYEELLVFSTISQKSGFIDKISTLISEFKRVGITSEDLKEKLSERNRNEMIDRKLKDINLIFDYFNQFMTKGYFDEEDKLALTLEKLEESKMLDNAYIWIDGFDSFSSQELLVIDKMVKLSNEISISLTIDIFSSDSSKDLFSTTISTFESIRNIAKKYEKTEKKIDLIRKDYLSDLECLEKEFFSYPYKIYEDVPENIEINLNNNYYDEIEKVAISIVNLIRKDNYRYSEIAIISGDLNKYSSIIKRTFKEYGIPYFIDEKVSIMNHPIIKMILSTISCLNSGFKYEDVFKLIKTGLTDVDEGQIEILENYVIQYGIRGNRWFKEFEYGNNLDELNNIRIAFIKPFIKLKENIKTKNKVADLTKYLFEYLLELNIPLKLKEWIEYLRENKKLSHVQESTQIWNLTLEIFDQLVELEGEDIKTFKEYNRILDAGFSEIKLGIIPPALDQVVIGDIERSKSRHVKAMFLIGLNDGVIPKKFGDEGIILDDEKKLLKEEGLDLKTDSTSIMERDQFSTYVALSKATNKLFISYSSSDGEGKSLRPSVYIDKFIRVFPKLKIMSHVLEDNKNIEILNEETLYKELAKNLRKYTDDIEINTEWFNILNWYENNPIWKDRIDILKEGLFYDNQVLSIGSKSVELYDLPLRSSVTRLEKFVTCPFAHFIKYGLRPKDRKKYEIKLPDIGLLFHKTVEEFDFVLRENNKSWFEITREESDIYVENIVNKLVEEYSHKIFESSSKYKYLIKKLKRVGKRAVWTLVNQVKQGEFLPYAHEVEFSLKGQMESVSPIVIELNDGQRIMLEGRVDRVDIYEKDGKKYVKIIDYKSGSKKFDLSEVYYGTQLQLVTYLDAILQNSEYFKVDKLYPAGVFYFKIDDPLLESESLKGDLVEPEILKKLKMDGILLKDTDIAVAMDKNILENRKSDIIPFEIKKDDSISARSKALEEEEFSDLLVYVKEKIKDIGEKISEGVTKIEPTKNKNITSCQYCDYLSICQFDTLFNNNYKNLKSYKDKEIIELIKKKDGGEKNA